MNAVPEVIELVEFDPEAFDGAGRRAVGSPSPVVEEPGRPRRAVVAAAATLACAVLWVASGTSGESGPSRLGRVGAPSVEGAVIDNPQRVGLRVDPLPYERPIEQFFDGGYFLKDGGSLTYGPAFEALATTTTTIEAERFRVAAASSADVETTMVNRNVATVERFDGIWLRITWQRLDTQRITLTAVGMTFEELHAIARAIRIGDGQTLFQRPVVVDGFERVVSMRTRVEMSAAETGVPDRYSAPAGYRTEDGALISVSVRTVDPTDDVFAAAREFGMYSAGEVNGVLAIRIGREPRGHVGVMWQVGDQLYSVVSPDDVALPELIEIAETVRPARPFEAWLVGID